MVYYGIVIFMQNNICKQDIKKGNHMNAKNKDLFFNENDDETVIVTIAPETSEEFDVDSQLHLHLNNTLTRLPMNYTTTRTT